MKTIPLMLALVLATMLSSLESTKKTDAHVISQATEPRLDANSSLHGLLTLVFEDGGWPRSQASMAAGWALDNRAHAGFSQDPPAMPEGATLSVHSSVHGLITLGFVSGGWTPAQASMVASERLDEYVARAVGAGLGDECTGYIGDIIYCSGGHTKRFVVQMHKACYETIFGTTGAPNPCNFLSCQSPNRRHLSLTTTSDCDDDLPNGCVWLMMDPTPVRIDCLHSADCDCFEETSPLDCNAIEAQCCPQ